MGKVKPKRFAPRSRAREPDSVYFLKMVVYIVLGSMWLRIYHGDAIPIPIPIGLLAGILFTLHERLQIDRKLEYAILLMAMFIGFWLPIGLSIYF